MSIQNSLALNWCYISGFVESDEDECGPVKCHLHLKIALNSSRGHLKVILSLENRYIRIPFRQENVIL